MTPNPSIDPDVRAFVATAIEVAHGTRDVLLATLDAAEDAHRALLIGDAATARAILANLIEAGAAFRVRQALGPIAGGVQ
jgi:hypothetical protein